jgi:hypothetical protein
MKFFTEFVAAEVRRRIYSKIPNPPPPYLGSDEF